MPTIDIPTITHPRLEAAISAVRGIMAEGRSELTVAAMRAAKDRDPKLMLALERGAEALVSLNETQYGRTQRTSDERVQQAVPTEVSLWVLAYKLADSGSPSSQLAAVYATAFYLTKER